jgi:hypothetical protein
MAEFQLWDIEAGSYIGKYADEREALSTVKKLVDHFGSDYAESLSLGRIEDNGNILAPLSGNELVARIGKYGIAPDEEAVSRPMMRKATKPLNVPAKLTARSSKKN